MPLDAAIKQILLEANYYVITGFSVDVPANIIYVNYKVGIKQDDGKIQIVKDDMVGRITDPALLGPVFIKYRTAIKADLYKLCQNAGIFPAGVLT